MNPPLLVVGWAAADWVRLHGLLDAGFLPRLANLVEHGVSGPVAAVEPSSNASLWTTVATGDRADEHGVHHEVELDPATGAPRPATACSWRTPALWHSLAAQGRRCHVVGWPATHPGGYIPRGGVMVTDSYSRPSGPPTEHGVASWPLLRGAVTADDPELVADLAQLRVSPAEIDAGLLAEFVPRWQELDFTLDPRPRKLALALAETLSVHSAVTFLLEAAPADAVFVHYALLERLAAAFLPCSDDALSSLIGPRHAEIYAAVLPTACRWLDGFLGRLQNLAGPRATVCVVSPSGYLAPERRLPLVPAVFPPTAEITGWRRTRGMFAVSGPEAGLRVDTLVHSASVLHLVPLFARLARLPSDGPALPSTTRLLSEIFVEPTLPPLALPDVPILPGNIVSAAFDLSEACAFRDQFLSTGEWPCLPDPNAVRRERGLALARAYSHAGRAMLAVPILASLHLENPEDPDIGFALAQELLQLGRLGEARAAAEPVFDHTWGTPQAEFLLGHFDYCEGRYEQAFMRFQAVGEFAGALPGWENQLGLALLKLGRFDEARAVFNRALTRAPDDANTYLGLGHSCLRLGDYSGAVAASRGAIALRYDHPLAHFNLGIALARLGESSAAIEQMEMALDLIAGFERDGEAGSGGSLAGHARRILAVLRRRSAVPATLTQKPEFSQGIR